MHERVKVEIDTHVARVTLNRADKRNAVDLPMFEALIATGERLAADSSVRAIVLQGAGDNFCAGIDISVFQEAGIAAVAANAMEPREGSPANFFQSAAYIWREVPVPVIAAIEGCAFGAGMQIALGADLRIAAENAKLSIMEVRWGLIPDMAISTTLRHVMPLDRARELAYTGRIVSGAEARDLGLVTSLADDPVGKAFETAAEIASRSPDATRAAKRLFKTAWQQTDAEALRTEAALQTKLMGSPNQLEAVMANLHKRTADFSDPKP